MKAMAAVTGAVKIMLAPVHPILLIVFPTGFQPPQCSAKRAGICWRKYPDGKDYDRRPDFRCREHDDQRVPIAMQV
jgi:hypothetical protein